MVEVLDSNFRITGPRSDDAALQVGVRVALLDSVSWEDGAAAGLVAMAVGTGIRLEMDRALPNPGKSGPLYEAEHPATLLAMVEAGVGVAPLPGLAWPAIDHPILTFRQLTAPLIERELYLIKRAGRDLSPAGRALYRSILSGAQSRLHELEMR
jgi:DNA-binding transcriptional LysR family regulator